MRSCLFILGFLLFSTLCLPASSQVVSTSNFQNQVQTTISDGKNIHKVMLTGTAEWFAGSLHASGTAQLEANADGSTSIQLSLGQASRTETQTSMNSSRTCQWTDSAGKSHDIAGANCFTSVPWFAPSLVMLSPSQRLPLVISTDDGEVSRHGSSFHQIRCTLNPAVINDVSMSQVIKTSTSKILIDPKTLLPASLEYSIHPDGDDSQSIDVKVLFSDYRSVSGVMLPFHIERYVQRTLQLKLDISSASLE